MNELKQKYIELSAIAFEKAEDLNKIKSEIEKLKVLIQYLNEQENNE